MPRKAVALTGRSDLVRTDIAHHRRKRLGQFIGVDGRCCRQKRKMIALSRSQDRLRSNTPLFGGLLANYNPGASRHPRRSNERAEPQC